MTTLQGCLLEGLLDLKPFFAAQRHLPQRPVTVLIIWMAGLTLAQAGGCQHRLCAMRVSAP